MKSSLLVGEEGWRPGVVPVGLGEQGSAGQRAALSPAAAEGWVCCRESTSPGSDGKCLGDKNKVFVNQSRLERD